MTSFGFTIKLRNKKSVEKYKEYHRNVWPEISGKDGALEKVGVKKMRIFYMKPLTLFMYVEGKDGFNPAIDFARALDLDPKVKEWDNIMHGQLLIKLEENDGLLEWAIMEDIFNYEQ